MRNTNQINELELRKAIEQLKPDGELFEIRIIGNNKPISGYFKSADEFIQALDTVDLRNTNVYITLNDIKDSLYSRQQADRLLVSKNTTADKEVDMYKWLFVDLDPERETGISSSDDELRQSKELADIIYQYLKGQGFEEPVFAMSGNGYHLLYRIQLQNTEENEKLIEKCLKALDFMFSTDSVKVDTSTYNPSRIHKMYGTLAQKGRNSGERPHRMSYIIGDIKDVQKTSKIYLEKLAAELPVEEVKPAKYNNYNPAEFDIESWMSSHGIRYTAKSWNGITKYVLDECPFDSNHKAPDSSIFIQSNGAIGFKCLHNSCEGKRWQDVRVLFEPDAYEKKNLEYEKAIEEGIRRHNRELKADQVNVENGPVWEIVDEVLNKPTPDNEYIKTHIKGIDGPTHGLTKGGISIWSGLRASAKSTVLSQIILQTINDGHNVMAYSGELTDKRFVRWLIQQAAGRQYVKEVNKDDSKYYVVPNETQKVISNWIGDRLKIYNNSYGSDYEQLINSIESQIEECKPDLIVLDNLMTIDIGELDFNENKAQTKLMLKLNELAKKYNCHVAMVAHPRKSQSFLRLQDIAGSANISNLIDLAFIVHRVNHDFKVGYMAEFLPPKTHEEDVELFSATNVIEIAKDREFGTQDVFVSLWYESESRRLNQDPAETIKFGWTKDWNDFIPAEEDDIPYE